MTREKAAGETVRGALKGDLDNDNADRALRMGMGKPEYACCSTRSVCML